MQIYTFDIFTLSTIVNDGTNTPYFNLTLYANPAIYGLEDIPKFLIKGQSEYPGEAVVSYEVWEKHVTIMHQKIIMFQLMCELGVLNFAHTPYAASLHIANIEDFDITLFVSMLDPSKGINDTKPVTVSIPFAMEKVHIINSEYKADDTILDYDDSVEFIKIFWEAYTNTRK